MKYLIQNRKEFAITVAAFVMAVFNLGKSIKAGEGLSEDLVTAVLVTFTTILAWWFNMPTSEANCKYTGMMRLEKAQENAEQVDGENFYDDWGTNQDPDTITDDGIDEPVDSDEIEDDGSDD